MDEHIKILEEKRGFGINSGVTIRYILGIEHGKLGELYHDSRNNIDFTMKDWELKGGTEDIYYSCKDIAIKLWKHAVKLDNRKPFVSIEDGGKLKRGEALNIHISMMEVNIDGQKKIHFYAILNDEVIGSGSIAYPYEKDAYLMAGYVIEKYRGKGLWKKLFDIRCKWIKENSPAEDLMLFVDEKNPMKATYEKYGFSTYIGKDTSVLAKTLDGQLWMRKSIKNG